MTKPLFGKPISDKPRPIVVVNFDRYTVLGRRRPNFIYWGVGAHREPVLMDLPPEERWLWTVLLGLAAGGDPVGVVRHTPIQIARDADMTVASVLHALTHFRRSGWLASRVSPRIYRRTKRQKIPARLREAVIARDGMVCGICGTPTTVDVLAIDHRRPVKFGGTDDLENLQVAHGLCNSIKGVR